MLIKAALTAPPAEPTLASYTIRLGQHLAVYSVLLVAAIVVCLFVAAPLETAAVAVVCIMIIQVYSLTSASSRSIFDRILRGGLAASYVVGAGALLKALSELWHRI